MDYEDGQGLVGRVSGLVPDSFNPVVAPVVAPVNDTNVTSQDVVAVGAVPLNNSEIITLVLIGLIGLAGTVMIVHRGRLVKKDYRMLYYLFITVGFLCVVGTVMNIGVLTIVHRGRLVKKDYRMLYYLFITVGDLLFAIHTVLNALSICFRDFYVFKIFTVCLNLHVTLGVATYQWSAMCIVLLIIDLIWSLKNPFGSDSPKKRFSKISCIIAFALGLLFALGPFAFWTDTPAKVPFCSIANVYGSHWNVYQFEAVSVLSFLFAMMLGASAFLLYIIYRTYKPQQIEDIPTEKAINSYLNGPPHKPQQGKEPAPDLLEHMDFPSPHPVKRFSVDLSSMEDLTTGSDVKIGDAVEIITVSAAVDDKDLVVDHVNNTGHQGVDNMAYISDDVVVVYDNKDSPKSAHEQADAIPVTPIHSATENSTTNIDADANRTAVNVDKYSTYDVNKHATNGDKYSATYDHKAHESKNDVQRKQFGAACRNVGAFMATYLGCCLPYYILLIVTIDCAPACNQDTPGQRGLRVVVATFLYLLPILDPILYTQRFAIFKEAALDAVKPCCRLFRRGNVDTY